MHARTFEQWRDLLQGQALPLAVVDLDAFDRNVAHVGQLVGRRTSQMRVRVASKSLRVPDLLRRVLAYGPPYAGVMCYAAAEAVLLYQAGFDDLLVAYPTRQPADLNALREIHEQGATVHLVVDSLDGTEQIARAMAGVTRPFSLIIEADVSYRPLRGRVHIGVRRSPLRTVEAVVDLVVSARRFETICIGGVMAYEAQVAGVGDRSPFRRHLNPILRALRQRSASDVARRRQRLAQMLESAGSPPLIFNGAGTGSLTYACDEPWLTELTAGSAFLCPHLFDYYSNITFEPALFFALQCVRRSDADHATCFGGGYVASGQPGCDKLPLPYLPQGLTLVDNEGAGEVQTPLRADGPLALRIGDPVIFRHAKAGELAERFSHYQLVTNDAIVGSVPTYRGLGACFG